jgi:hypothetical protein
MSKGAITCDRDMASSDINESVVQTVKHNEVKAQRKLNADVTLVRQHASVKCFIRKAIIYLQDKTVFVLFFFLRPYRYVAYVKKKAWYIYKCLIVYCRQDIRIVTYFRHRHCNAVKLSLRGYLLRILLWFTRLIFGGIYTVATYEPYSWLKILSAYVQKLTFSHN